MATLRVFGLDELGRDAARAAEALERSTREAAREAAEETAEAVRASFAGRGGVAPKVAPSVRSQSSGRGGAVSFGGPAYPYAGGANFGSALYTQFEPRAGKDYSFFSTIDEREAAIEGRFEDAAEEALRPLR